MSDPYFWADYEKIAEHYGCYPINMNEEYAIESGNNYATRQTYYVDSIHQSMPAGQAVWAKAFFKRLNRANAAKTNLVEAPHTLPKKRLFYFTVNNSDAMRNYDVAFYNIPPLHDGTLVDSIAWDRNPVYAHGYSKCVRLTTGQKATYGIDDAIFMIPIIGHSATASTMQVKANANTIDAKQQYSIPGDSRILVSYNNTDYGIINAQTTDYAYQRSIEITCVSGQFDLLGVLVFSEVAERVECEDTRITKTSGITFEDFTTATYSKYGCTNTLNDKINFSFLGSAFGITLGHSNAGGILQITIDGVTQNYDAFNGQGGLTMKNVKFACAKGYGKHSVEIKYVSDNASISAAGYPRYRFQYRDIWFYSGKEDETERSILLKKWNS
jgi:hypothetical protein